VTQPFTHRLRVRYVECDMQGIVFNAHYYTWMDVAHTEWLRDRLGSPGVALEGLHRHGVDVVVAESSCRYLASATFDDAVDVEVALEHLGTTSMVTTHTFRRDGVLLAEGRVRHVGVAHGVSPVQKKAWPDAVRAALEG
jgi:acyl-CoA thioester hydrolase